MNKLKIIPLILCGGQGTRLWPLSRKSYPKQFLSLCGENNKSLLQQTQERISDLDGIDKPIIICTEEHRFLVAEQMREINITPKAIILEPVGRNTAPAIALGSIKALEEDKDSIILVLSADHVIKDFDIFHETLKVGFNYANRHNLVTFGIVPNKPETGFGYIESESLLDQKEIKASKIKKFIEKPNLELAREFLKNKHYTWNSGMFVFKTRVLINELEKHAPIVLRQCKESMINSQKDLDFIRVDKDSFSKAPNIPIDIAVMEKTTNGVVIPLDAGWSDIGSWKSLWSIEKKDSLGNVVKGKVVNEGSENCYIKSDERLLVTLGLEDLIVVDTPDATLVANKNNTDNLKSLVHLLDSKGFKEGILHKKIYRPWGSYISLIESKNWLVKKIEVNPNSQLSLQMHRHRAEHWVVVSGKAEIQIDEKNFYLTNNQSTFIPLGAKHRLKNPISEVLTIIEIQSGDFISEDDIIRFSDDYGRIDK